MKNYIKGLKILSIITLSCTVILFLILLGFSLMSGDSSKAFTDSVTNDVNQAFNIQDRINGSKSTQGISVSVVGKKRKHFIGDTVQLEVKAIPSDAKDIDVTYEVESYGTGGDGTVDENGLITFSHQGELLVKASLKSNPLIFSKTRLYCSGENPLDEEYPERAEIQVTGVPSLEEFTVGERAKVFLNNGNTTHDCIEFSIENPDIIDYQFGCFYPYKVGETTLNYTITNGVESKTFSKKLVVANDKELNIPPIQFKNNISLTRSERVDMYEILERESDSSYSYSYIVSSSDNSIMSLVDPQTFFVKEGGEVTLTFTSAFSNDVSNSVTLTIEKVKPEYIQILGNDKITPGITTYYSAEVYPVNYKSDIKWSVIDGRATIDENGTLFADFYGDVTIRCQSTTDESVYVDKTIKIVLYTSPYMFVRKLMGHAGLSALLGFGLMCTALFLCRKKYNCIWVIPIAFAYAGISELLQKFAPGRYCLFTDVIVDFVGTLVGMAVALILIPLILLIWRLISKNSFDMLINGFKVNTFRNLSVRSSTLEEKYFPHTPEEQPYQPEN